MAEDLDDGEFWLPSQFLIDDDIFVEKSKIKGGSNCETEARVCFPREFPFGFDSRRSSALSSPVESVISSTETESDEEDYLSDLTRQMAHSMLQEDEKSTTPAFGAENPKTFVMAGSPQSTLSAVGSWSGCSVNSSRGSPNGPSQVSSPPSTPLNGKDDAWDLLYEAAGQVVRMKMEDEELKYYYGRGLLGPPRKPTPISVPVKNPKVGFYSNQALTQQQLQTNQFQLLKQQQLMKQQLSSAWGQQGKLPPTVQQHQQQVQSRTKASGFGNSGRCGRPLGLAPSAWPPLHQQQQQQQHAGSGMRAVFLEGSGSRKESCGTGVFLPRRTGSPADSRKKPGCSTVLVPARVVQALNLNVNELGVTQPRLNGGFAAEHDSLMGRSNALLSQHKGSLRPQIGMNHEIRLPQEWTY